MATKTFDKLKQLAIQIRDEKTNKQNTATRVGTTMLEHINKLEQDYYDKTTINNRTSEYNVSLNHPTSGISGGNKYDLSTAIGQVPAELRTAGVTVSFLNESGDTEKWEFAGGGSWKTGSFSQVGSEKLIELEHKSSKTFSFTEYYGKILNIDGEFSVDLNWDCKVTPIYFCKEGDVFKYMGHGEGSSASALFYNGAKLVGYKTVSSKSSYEEIVIETGINGVQFSSVANKGTDVILDVKSDNFIETDYKTLQWKEDYSSTRNSLPAKNRKFNMQISYIHPENGMINEIYIGSSINDNEWGKDDNWEKVPNKNDIDNIYNRFNNRFEFTKYVGKYLNKNGLFTDDGNYDVKVTPIYFCNESDIFKYKGYGINNAVSYIFYLNRKIVGFSSVDSRKNYTDIIIPSGVNGVLFASIASKGTEVVLDVKSDNFTDDERKRIHRGIHFCGHSIWDYDNTLKGDPEVLLEGYQTRILNEFEFDDVQDISSSGTTLKSLYKSKSDILTGKDGDIYIIDTNTNDIPMMGESNLGTISDYENNTGTDTYYGALRVWVDKINELTNNDNIIIFSSMCRAKQYFTADDKEGYITQVYKFFNATLEICNKLNMYYVDQFNSVPINENNYELCYFDKIMHLNNYGYQIAVEPWINVLNQIYYKDIQNNYNINKKE